MSIKGFLSEFSLAELFQVLEKGNKTGQLVLLPSNKRNAKIASAYYIWFRQGNIVGAADRNDYLGLTNLIAQRSLLSSRVITTLAEKNTNNAPLGIFLKSKDLLKAEQLKRFFYIQVMQQVCRLFQLSEAKFEFQSDHPLPMAEMTGLNTPATEVTLAGLRVLPDWSMLEEKLPDANSALITIDVPEEIRLKLNKLELQVLQHSDATTSLKSIAQQTRLSLNQVRQIAFRLITVNLAEELPMEMLSENQNDYKSPNLEEYLAGEKVTTDSQAPSKSLLKNLLGFLQRKPYTVGVK